MQSLLRSIVAGPRAQHLEANLDLCYVTDNVIATSGPSATYPSLAYRNPLNALVRFLDEKHGAEWCIWEFRAEGTGYPDEEVYNRIWHFPWPDHHPPPFALVPTITASMRNWLHENDDPGKIQEGADKKKRVVVVHCKAGKGRSGTMAISYLMTHEGWTKEDALRRFTERRMRPGLGAGISIPSQLRWIDYVERWSRIGGRMYVERPVEVTEVHVWGLREGVTIAIQGYVEEGKKIKTFHTFKHSERDDFTDGKKFRETAGLTDVVSELVNEQMAKSKPKTSTAATNTSSSRSSSTSRSTKSTSATIKQTLSDPESKNTIFKPSQRVTLESSDINMDIERRAGWNAVTSIAHVWFNCFFEGNGPENYQEAKTRSDTNADDVEGAPWADQSGVFEIDWDAMDGLKGSSRKGARAFDRIAVVWKAVSDNVDTDFSPDQKSGSGAATPGKATQDTADLGVDAEGAEEDLGEPLAAAPSIVMLEPAPGENVSDVGAANWRGSNPNLARDAGDEEKNSTEERSGSRLTVQSEEGTSDSEDGEQGIRRGVTEQSQ